MKKLCFLMLSLVAATVVLHACSDDKEVESQSRFVLETDLVTEVGADATSYEIRYKIAGDGAGNLAMAESRSEWIEVKNVTTTAVTLSLRPNQTGAVREGMVDLKSPGIATLTITIRQAKPAPQIVVTSPQPLVIANTAIEAEIAYELRNPDSADKKQVVDALPKAGWLEVLAVDESTVRIKAKENGGDSRDGIVTLSYQGATSIDVVIRQTAYVAPAVIRVEGNTTVEVGMRESEQTVRCTVENGSVENLKAEPQVEWLRVESNSEGKIVVGVAANYEGAREGDLKLSYAGAEDVAVTFRQEARPKPVLTLRDDSNVIVADPNGNDERDQTDVLTAYYTIENPIEATKVTARSNDNWIIISEAFTSYVDFITLGNDTEEPREGTIVLSYRSADDVTVKVTQGVRAEPVITVLGEQPMRIGRKGTEIVYANYKIENRRGNETAEATPDVEWIHMIATSTGYMSFSVDANNSSEREGRIRLTYRNAEPVDFVVLQAGAPAEGGEGLVLTVSDITATSAVVGVVTYIDETYSVGVVPKSDLAKFPNDKAFVDQLVYEMRQEFASVPGGFYTFAQYFALTNDDSSVEFGTGEENPRLQSDTEYCAFAFDLSADADNNVSYSGMLYKKEFRTLPSEKPAEMTFDFSFEGEGTKAKLKCTPSDLTRPYCLCVLPKSNVDLSKGEEAAFRACVNLAGEFFIGEAVSTSYLSKYTSPFVALACGYDKQSGDITSKITVFEFPYPPVAATALLRRGFPRR